MRAARRPWRASGAAAAAAAAAALGALPAARAAPRVAVRALGAGGDGQPRGGAPPRSRGRLAVAAPPGPRGGAKEAGQPPAGPGGPAPAPAAAEEEERVFLDLGFCFDRSVQLLAVEFSVADPSPLADGRLKLRVLHPMPSLSSSATQWFHVGEPWPLAMPGGATPPRPGAYRADLEPPPRLRFADCLGWSLLGGGEVPLEFEEGGPDTQQVAWARSLGGLHDAVELFVKRGVDPLGAGEQRKGPNIDWVGLENRTYAVRLWYEPVEEEGAAAPAAAGGTGAEELEEPVVPGGNPACWRGGFTFESCCATGSRGGNPECWDSKFTFGRCCSLTASRRAPGARFGAPDKPHYELPHLRRGNPPNLGPLQDDEALLLYGLVRATRPRTILEFGTAAGFSSSNWLHAVADDPDARVFSFDIVAHPVVRSIEDTDPRFAFVQKSQTDFEPRDVEFRVIDVVLFDAGHLVEYSLRAFERVLPRLSPTAIVAVHDTGLHVHSIGAGGPPEAEGRPLTEEVCARLPGGAAQCRRFPGCAGPEDELGLCVGRAHRPSERRFVREVLRRWPHFRALHVHSRRVFRHGLTLLQRGELWDPEVEPAGDF